MTKTATLLFLVLVLCSVDVFAADVHELEKQLISDYEGKTLTLRHFYHGDHLRFRWDGSVSGDVTVGPWTVDGQLSVQSISLRDGVIELKGRRIYVVFDSADKPVDILSTLDKLSGKDRKDIEKFLRGLRVQIEIELPSNLPDSQDASSAMHAIFLSPGESMLEIVPTYWRGYFAKLENREAEKPKETLNSATGGGGVKRPHPKFTPDPEYSEAARQVKYQGTELVSLVCAPSGTAGDLQIVRPLGVGLDEQAIAAVSTWTFDPATKDGTPVPVFLNIEVQFRLY